MSGPSLARVREPILTITRRARATTARGLVAVMCDEIVEPSVEASSEVRGYAGHPLEGTVHPRCGRVEVVLATDPRTTGHDIDRDGARERPIDRGADLGRFLDVNDKALVGSTLLEVPIEQPPENVCLDRTAEWQEEPNRSQRFQRTRGDFVPRDSQGSQGQPSSLFGHARLREHLPRLSGQRKAVTRREVVEQSPAYALEHRNWHPRNGDRSSVPSERGIDA